MVNLTNYERLTGLMPFWIPYPRLTCFIQLLNLSIIMFKHKTGEQKISFHNANVIFFH